MIGFTTYPHYTLLIDCSSDTVDLRVHSPREFVSSTGTDIGRIIAGWWEVSRTFLDIPSGNLT